MQPVAYICTAKAGYYATSCITKFHDPLFTIAGAAMSLPHALMTSLLEKACSGYDLARRFEKSIGYFWRASHQQIYRELGRMEEAGWIRSEAAEDAGKSRKRVYEVLPAGREELARWALEPVDPPSPRDEFFVKLRTDAVMGPLGLEQEIERRMGLHKLRLAAYRAIEARDFQGKTLSRLGEIQYLILRAGIMQEEGFIQWSEEALGVLGRVADLA